jgi:hypothetical protein
VIVFDLRCGNAHVFEAWFGSSDDYADQKGRGLISCPMCGDAGIDKAAMAPNVSAKGNSRAEGQGMPVAMSDRSPDGWVATLPTRRVRCISGKQIRRLSMAKYRGIRRVR